MTLSQVNIILFFFFTFNTIAQIGIGTTSPENSAILDVSSIDKGVLLPRMTTLQRDNITSPIEGLLIYNTDIKCLNIYDGNGAWDTLGECDYSSQLSFTSSIVYNGPSPINSTGIGFYNEPIDVSSTITVGFSATNAVPYTFTATDVATGLTYTASGTSTVGTGQTATLIPSATAVTVSGTINMTLTGASNTLSLAPRIDIKSLSANSTNVVDIGIDVDNADGDNDPTTGTFEQIWMDRNLGAHRKTTGIAQDRLSYGSLYQWGRDSDGHELIVYDGNGGSTEEGFTNTTSTLSAADTPGHDLFITSSGDWITPSNENLWQGGVSAINNPCPSGYRLPTQAEFTTLVSTLGITDMTTAFNSVLAFSTTGRRSGNTGNIHDATLSSNSGAYQISTIPPASGTSSRQVFNNFSEDFFTAQRATAYSIRCIKD